MSANALLAILGMALATYVTRVSGLFLLRGVVVRGRLKAALDALPLALAAGVSEYEIIDYFRSRAAENASAYASFLGAGVYAHYLVRTNSSHVFESNRCAGS